MWWIADAMGKFNAASNNIFQSLNGAVAGGICSTPAYFNGSVYYGDVCGTLKVFTISSAKLAAPPDSQSSTHFAYPGTAAAVSANGAANGIVWAHENTKPAVLHAYDAGNLAHELYNSNQAAAGRDHFGAGNKFITPTIADGKVFVGTTNSCGGIRTAALTRSRSQAWLRHHRSFLGNHLLEPLQVRNQRRLVDHSHLADDRRALRKAARRIGPHHIGVDSHELWKSLREHAEVAGLQLAADGMENHDAGSHRNAGQRLPEGAFERNHRHVAAAPTDDAGVPGRRIGHFSRRLIADHFRDAGARHDQPLSRQRHQQTVKLFAQFGHAASSARPRGGG